MTEPAGPDRPIPHRHDDRNDDDNDNDNERRSPSVNTPADPTARPDQPLHDPLPYGLGFTAPEFQGYGSAAYGVAPGHAAHEPTAPRPSAPAAGGVEVVESRRGGSPVLAMAGLASLGVAVWAILGAPVLSTTVVLAAALVLLILVGLTMVIRR